MIALLLYLACFHHQLFLSDVFALESCGCQVTPQEKNCEPEKGPESNTFQFECKMEENESIY